MPDDIIIMHARNCPIVNMQIRAANGCRGYPDQYIILFLKLGISNFFYFHFLLSLVSNSFHDEDHSFESRVITKPIML